VTNHGLVVSVVLLDESIRLGEGDGDQAQTGHAER
jgi:hypothetical protein